MTHQTISFLKSGIRIAGYLLLIPYSLWWLATPALILVMSEVVGIVEEFGEK